MKTDKQDNDMKLEMKLSPGIHESGLSSFPDYSEDIKNTTFKKNEFPFVNQDQVFMQLARTLSTDYPYTVLVGDQGIGKSMILDYSVDLLTGKRKLSELKKIAPDAVPLFEKIIKQAKNFSQRSYLLLPNLKDPMNVESLMYEDYDDCYGDYLEAKGFADDLGETLNSLAESDRSKIRISVSKNNFKKYIASATAQLYRTLHLSLRSRMGLNELNAEVYPLVHLTLPENLGADIESTFNFYPDDQKEKIQYLSLIDFAGFTPMRTNVTLEDIEEGISATFIPHAVDGTYHKIIAQVSSYDVTGFDDDKKFDFFREQFEAYSIKYSQQIITQIKLGKIKNPGQMGLYDINIATYYEPPSNVSQSTIDFIVSEIDNIRQAYTESASPRINKWMDEVYSHFADNPRVIRNAVIRMLDDIDDVEANLEIFKIHMDSPGVNPELKNKSDAPSEDNGKDSKKEDLSLPRACSSYDEVKFMIKHGTKYFEIEDIMQINSLESKVGSSDAVTYGNIGTSRQDNLFAFYLSADDAKENPPHMQLFDLGPFFQYSILLFQDSFSDFISSVAGSGKDNPSMREQFLEYLQTGYMTLVNEGISYKFHAPKMILACDNDDPFVTTKGVEKRDEVGLRGRIKAIPVPEMTVNSKETRHGTLKVLHNAIQAYNAKDTTGHVTFTTEAKNMLLQSMLISENLMSLSYRDFSKEIEDICSFAESRGVSKISGQVLKDRELEDLPADFFLAIDRELSYGGYFSEPKEDAGMMNGLWVNEHNNSGRVSLKSYFVPGIDKIHEQMEHFQLVDINSALSDESTYKGYDLARDYLISLLYKHVDPKVFLDKGRSWVLKTYFKDNWDKIGGPSASMAITVSMLSALAGENTYRNRFMTGAIDPMHGASSKIGGTFYKGLVPYRFATIAPEDEKSEMYFMFPASNLLDLTKDAIFDPFGLEEKVHCLPIQNFAQAYFLSTCGQEITQTQWNESKKYSTDKLAETFKKVEERFKKLK